MIACCGATSTCRCRPASSSRCSDPTAAARRRCSRCCSGSCRWHRCRAGGRQAGHLGQRAHRLCAATPPDRPGCDAAGRDLVGWVSTGGAGESPPLRSTDRARRRARWARRCDRSTLNAWPMSGCGVMSGGELQRVRIAQALVADPHAAALRRTAADPRPGQREAGIRR